MNSDHLDDIIMVIRNAHLEWKAQMADMTLQVGHQRHIANRLLENNMLSFIPDDALPTTEQARVMNKLNSFETPINKTDPRTITFYDLRFAMKVIRDRVSLGSFWSEEEREAINQLHNRLFEVLNPSPELRKMARE